MTWKNIVKNNLDVELLHYEIYGKSVEVEHYFVNKRLHREDGPALVVYVNGVIEKEEYYINGTKVTDSFRIMVVKGLQNEIRDRI